MKSRRTKLAPLEDGQIKTLSASGSIKHKKELMREVRRVNPASVNTAPKIFWDVEGSLKSLNSSESDIAQQMNIVENGVNYNIKRYNDLRVMNEKQTMQLRKSLDALENEKNGFQTMDAMKKANTEESKRIGYLNDQIDVVETGVESQLHYARKLSYMLNRLKSNQLKFDSHMIGMEDTMRNIDKERAEVKLLRRGLDAGLAKAVIVCEETRDKLGLTRKDRENLMAIRKKEFSNAKLLSVWLKDREQMKKQLGIELRGELTMDEELFLRSQIETKGSTVKSLQKDSEQCLKELQTMEEAFSKLKHVTGVRDVTDMHEKFSNQKSNKIQLEQDVKDAEQRLLSLKGANQRQEAFFQELRSSGSGSNGVQEMNRESIVQLEAAYSNAKTDQKFIRADLKRLGAVLLGLHQGASGLLQRIEPHSSLAEGGLFELTQVSGEDRVPWTDTVESLNTAETVLTKMMEVMSGNAAEAVAAAGFDEDDMDSVGTGEHSAQTSMFEDEPPMDAVNVRIKSRKNIRDTEKQEETGEMITKKEPGGWGEEAEVLHLGNTGATLNNNPIESAPGDEGMITAGLQPAKLSADPHTQDPKMKIPSRGSVKGNAVRASREADRAEEMETRKKRLQEKMAEFSKGGGEGAEDYYMRTAQLKAQRESADRLCVERKVATLPEGVTLRDDPMTKTNAFIMARPKLV